MKRLICLIIITGGLIALLATPAIADTEIGNVTGAGAGQFEAGAAFGVVSLDSVDVGIGVLINSNGSAKGVFHAVLLGHSLLGPSEITVEGTVNAGALGPFTNFSGIATLDLGDGTLPLPGVPFSVTVSGSSMVLALDATTLAPAGLSGVSISIE